MSQVLVDPAWAESVDTYSDVQPEYYDNVENRPAGETYDSVNHLQGLDIFEDTDCDGNKFCPDDLVDARLLLFGW